ncbi:MAG: peptidylprolyl isomerase [Reinekea sp.]
MDLKSVLLPIVLLVACSNDDNLAKVGNETITKPQFDAHLAFKRINPDQTERVNAELDHYLQQTALANAITDSDVIDQDQLQAEVDEFKKQMLVSRYMSTYLDKSVNSTAIENYYNAHQNEFARKQAHVAHIVIRVHSAMSAAEQQAAQQKARDVLAKLGKGEEFAALATEYSDDLYSAENGGDLGWVTANSIDPAFAKAVFDLEPGQTSDIVKTQYGYHVIKLLDPLKQQVAPLSQVEGDIRYQLRQKAKQAETERLLNSIKITINK